MKQTKEATQTITTNKQTYIQTRKQTQEKACFIKSMMFEGEWVVTSSMTVMLVTSVDMIAILMI
jgi:hypothetical protein